MAGPRLEELRERVRDRMAAHVSDSFLTNDRIDRTINHALRQITAEHDWFWLQDEETITTSVGIESYPVPEDYLRTDSLTDAESGSPLATRAIREILQTIRQGRPTVYAVYGGDLRLRAIPDKTYTITHLFYKTEPELVGDADRPLISDPFIDGVIEYTAYLLFRATRESDKATEALTAYGLWLRRTQDNTKQTRAPIRVTVRPGAEF